MEYAEKRPIKRSRQNLKRFEMNKSKSKLILTVIMALAITVFMSCEKEESTQKVNQDQSVEVVNKEAPGGYGVHRHYFDNGKVPGVEGVDYGCVAPAVSCLDDIIIVVSAELHHVFEKVIENHNVNQGNDVIENDINIFKEHEELLAKEMFAREDIQSIIQGECTLSIRGNEKKISIKDKNYFVFSNEDEPTKIYPIQLR